MQKDIILTLIREKQAELPFVLESQTVAELMGTSRNTVYMKLRKGEIPGAKNIKGIGWRINRDLFLAWLYCQEVEN